MCNKKEPLISIIVTVYNSEKHLPNFFACFDKVHNTNYEIIFVNDGSTDNTTEILNNYCATKNSRARVYYIANHGVAYARNYGISKCEGEYVCIVDADDLFHPSLFNTLLLGITKYNADISICSPSIIFRKKRLLILHHKTHEKFWVLKNPEDMFEKLLGKLNIWGTTWGKMYKSSFLKKMPNYPNIFSLEHKIHEDAFFNIKYFAMCKNLAYCKKKLYCYRLSNGGASQKNCSKEKLDETYMLIKKLYNTEWFNSKRVQKAAKSQCALLSYVYLRKSLKFKILDDHQSIQDVYKFYKKGIKNGWTSWQTPFYIRFGIPFTWFWIYLPLKAKGILKKNKK